VEINPVPRAAGALLFRPAAITMDGRPPTGRGPQAGTPPVHYRDGTLSVTFVAVRPLAGAGRNWYEEAAVLEQIIT
jgi:hypothetical protein